MSWMWAGWWMLRAGSVGLLGLVSWDGNGERR